MDFFKNIFKNTKRPFFPDDNSELPNIEPHHRQEYDEIFSDSFKIHEFFDKQIYELLKSFSGISPSFAIFSDFNSTRDSADNQSLRDQFLKNADKKSKNNNLYKKDQDLDGEVIFGNLGSLLEGSNMTDNEQYNGNKEYENFFSSHSQVFKAVTLPNGTIQTETVKKDIQGNEEKVVCHQLGIKQYCVIRTKDRNGKEELTESFININEDEKESFVQTYRNLS